MAYTVTTRNSYGSRLSNSAKGVGMGFILLILGTILLFWNEKRTAYTGKMLKEAHKTCVELGDISVIHPEMDSKFVHATGLASTAETLGDSQTGVSTNAVKLIRRVEYYQWVESSTTSRKDKVGGAEEVTTTYDYDLEWVDSPVDSKSFADPSYRNANSVLVDIPDQTLRAQKVDFGAYRLSGRLIEQMSGEVPLNVDIDAASLKSLLPSSVTQDGLEHISVRGNVIYLKEDPKTGSDDVGDVRITYTQVPGGNVSILATVQGDTFGDFTAKNGYSMQTLYQGTRSMEEMFTSEKEGNKTLGWILRLVGFLLLYFGFRSIFDILTTLLKVLPFLSRIMGFGVGIVALILALVWGLLVCGVAIMIYRPVVGILVIAVAVGIFILTSSSGKGKITEPLPSEGLRGNNPTPPDAR